MSLNGLLEYLDCLPDPFATLRPPDFIPGRSTGRVSTPPSFSPLQASYINLQRSHKRAYFLTLPLEGIEHSFFRTNPGIWDNVQRTPFRIISPLTSTTLLFAYDESRKALYRTGQLGSRPRILKSSESTESTSSSVARLDLCSRRARICEWTVLCSKYHWNPFFRISIRANDLQVGLLVFLSQ